MTLRESYEATQQKIRKLRRGERPEERIRQREEAIAKGKEAYQRRLQAIREGKARQIAEEQYQRELAEYERQKAEYERQKAEYEAQLLEYERQQAILKERQRQEQMWFWTKRAAGQIKSGAIAQTGKGAVYSVGYRYKDPKTGKYVESTTLEEMKAKLQPPVKEPQTQLVISKEGQTMEETLIEKGYSKEDVKELFKSVEKYPSGFKVVEKTEGGQTRVQLASIEQEKYEYAKKVAEQKYESLSYGQKVVAHAHTLLSPKGWEYITASIPTEKIPLLKEGVGAKTGKEVVIEEAIRVSSPKYKVPKTLGMKLAVGAAESAKSPPVQLEMLALGAQGFSLATATTTGSKIIGLKVASIPVSKVALAGVGAYYYGGRGVEAYGLAKEKRYEEAIGVGIRTGAETVSMGVGARAAIREMTTFKAKELPARVQKDFFEKFKAVEKLKDVEIKEVDLLNVERIPSRKAADILMQQIRKRGLILGGSAAEQAQLKEPSILSPHDIDLYAPWYRKPRTEAIRIEKLLKSAGIERVSRIRAEVTIAGEKAIEIHPASEFLYSNIKTVERVLTPIKTRIGETPSGIKVLKIKPQLKRELVAGYLEGSQKHLERFEQTFPDVLSQQAQRVVSYSKGMIKSPISILFKPKEVVEPSVPTVIKQPTEYPKYPSYKSYVLGTAPYQRREKYKPVAIYKANVPYKPAIISKPKPYKKDIDIPIPMPYKGKKKKPIKPIKPPYKPIKQPKLPPYKKPSKPTVEPPYKPVKITKVTPIRPIVNVPSPSMRVPRVKRRKTYIWARKYAYRPSLTGISKGGLEETKFIEDEPKVKMAGVKIRYRIKKKKKRGS